MSPTSIVSLDQAGGDLGMEISVSLLLDILA